MTQVTNIQMKDFVWTWKIKNFINLRLYGGSVTSNPINCGDNEICMAFKVSDSASDKFVGILPFITHCKSKAVIMISLLNSDNERVVSQRFLASEVPSEPSERIGAFVEESFILDEKNKLLPDGTLTIVCRVCFGKKIQTCTNGRVRVQVVDEPSAFQQKLNNDPESDFKLIVGDRHFAVNKSVLSAKSVTFADIFYQVSMRPIDDQVELVNIDADVLEEMLLFIYTGRVERMKEIAIRLLKASHEFKVERLEQLTSAAVVEGLNLENIGNVLHLTERHKLYDLKPHVLEFITKHAIALNEPETFDNSFYEITPNLRSQMKVLINMSLQGQGNHEDPSLLDAAASSSK